MATYEYNDLNEYEKLHADYRNRKASESPKSVLCTLVIAVVCFALGFGLRDSTSSIYFASKQHHEHGPMPQQNFVPKGGITSRSKLFSFLANKEKYR